MAMNTRILVVATLVATLSRSAAAQLASWTQLMPATIPSARLGALAYDAARQETVLCLRGLAPPGDTWVWNGTDWQLRVLGPVVFSTSVAYDSMRQRTVLFGGRVGGTSFSSGTSEWDGTSWLGFSPATHPSARSSIAIAYDAARQRTVLFGGVLPTAADVNDTWEWDGSNWQLRTPATSPSPRRSSMTYDLVRQRIVLFGGFTATGSLNDTWEWDGVDWQLRIPATSPSPRNGAAMAYDTTRQRVVLFGGASPAGSLNDTWEWDGVDWQQRVLAASPSPRVTAIAYDSVRQRMVLFGGSVPGVGFADDTWELVEPVPASATSYGTGCGSPALAFAPDPGGKPVIGQTARATITNAPTLVAGVAMGTSNTTAGAISLPYGLAVIGMPGCLLLQSSEVLGLGVTPLTATSLAFTFSVPPTLSLVGIHVYIQAYAFAPGVNPLQVVSSNGIDWRVGSY